MEGVNITLKNRIKVLQVLLCLLILIVTFKGVNEAWTSNPLTQVNATEFGNQNFQRASPQQLTEVSNYLVDVELDTLTRTLVGNETLQYFNSENIELEEVFFHLWMKAISNFVTIHEVTDEAGKPLSYQTLEDTNLKVSLNEPVAPRTTTIIKIEFSLLIPAITYRFGYSELIYNLGNWLPIAAVYDENGWDVSPYSFAGESFYADAANFHVNITVPNDEVIAASGELTDKIVHEDNRVTWVWKAELMRDFYFSCSSKFKIASTLVDGVNLSSYYLPGHEDRGASALRIGENAVKAFSSLLKPYPYSTLRIVETYLGTSGSMLIAGMEYPAVVLIDRYFYTSGSFIDLERVVSHEIAHQWFAFMVGNDPYEEPWLDEGFASYSELLYSEYVYGQAAKREQLDETRLSYDNWRRNHPDDAVGRSMEYWEKKESNYFPTVYRKGSLIIEMLRMQVGNTTFFQAMQTYFDEFLYKNARISDLMKVFERVAGYELDWFFKEWVFDEGAIHYTVTILFESSSNLVLSVEQEDTPKKMLVPFEMSYKNGESATKMAWVNETQQTVMFKVSQMPASVVVDPENLILGTKSVRPLLDPLIRVMVAFMGFGVTSFLVFKKRRKLRFPTTPIDAYLDKQINKEESLSISK